MHIGTPEVVTARIGESQGYQGLPVHIQVIVDQADGQERLQYTSAWQPAPDEIIALMAGAQILVHVIGGQPPILVEIGPQPAKS